MVAGHMTPPRRGGRAPRWTSSCASSPRSPPSPGRGCTLRTGCLGHASRNTPEPSLNRDIHRTMLVCTPPPPIKFALDTSFCFFSVQKT